MAIDPTQQTPAPPDTPAPSAPEGTPDPYEKRYNDLRPQYDRTAAEAAELRRKFEALESDPEVQREFLARLGYEIEDPDPDPYGGGDPADELAARVAAMEQCWESMTAAEQEREQIATITANVNEQFKALPTELDDADKEIVQSYALLSLPKRPDGMPDIEGAYKVLTERDARAHAKAQQEWRDGKRRIPTPPANGVEGSNAPNLDDTQQRRAWMAQQLEHMQAQG